MRRIGAGEASRAVESHARTIGLPVFGAQLVPDQTAAAALKDKKVLAFAGIGRPEKFFDTLKAAGAEVVEARGFDEHQRYSAGDARDLLAAAKARGLLLVTTEKDVARMQGDATMTELAATARVLPVQLQFNDEAAVRVLLERTLKRARA